MAKYSTNYDAMKPEKKVKAKIPLILTVFLI